MAKTPAQLQREPAQLQREIDETLSRHKPQRYIVKIPSEGLPDFVRELRGSRRVTYFGPWFGGEGAPCLEIELDEEVARPAAFLQEIARRANCTVEISAK